MENLLEVVEQFLSLSDEKLEELAAKNHLLRLQEEREEKKAQVSSSFIATCFYHNLKSS